MSVNLTFAFFNNWPTPNNGVGTGLTADVWARTVLPKAPQNGDLPPSGSPLDTQTTSSSTVTFTTATAVNAYVRLLDGAGKSWWFAVPSAWWGDGLTHYGVLIPQAAPSGQAGVVLRTGPQGLPGTPGLPGATGPPGPSYTVVAQSTTYAVNNLEAVEADASGGGFTITSADRLTGHAFKVTKVDSSAHAVTIALSAGNINGSASIQLTQQWQSVEIRCDGTNGTIN